MPLYEYKCQKCGYEGEVIAKDAESGVMKIKCEKCGVFRLRKKPSAPNIHFKGEGWTK